MKRESLHRLVAAARAWPVIGIFFEKSFVHYTWTGIFISSLNVFLLWLFIDKAHIPTVLASIIIVGGTFLLRFVLLRMGNAL